MSDLGDTEGDAPTTAEPTGERVPGTVTEAADVREDPTGSSEAPADSEVRMQAKDPHFSQSPRSPALIVGIGASAGGLAALERTFRALPADLGASYIVIVHLSPNAKSMMAELIGRHTRMKVTTVESGIPIEPNRVYVIPPDHNVLVRDGRLVLAHQDRSPGHGALYPIDIFFESLANEARSRAVAIILSGTGSDGSRGIRHIRDQGGVVLIQSRESAQFDGMPASALATGLWDLAAEPEELATKVAQLVAQTQQSPAGVGDSRAQAVLAELRNGLGMDFSYIKLNVLSRRTWRRMMLLGVHEFDDYIAYLQSNLGEVQALRDDLLINVTSFFRDPPAFRALATEVLPKLLLSKPPGEDLRVWVPACASGEEAYSIAMVLHEIVAATGRNRDFRIFATDVDENALEKAQRGTYSESSVRDLPAEYRRRFLHPRGESFMIDPSLRERLIFSRHNVMTAPPFTHMDLVSCRNLLIYLTKEAHEALVASLHFSLELHGVLLLGAAESVSPYETEFSCIHSTGRLFRKKTEVLLPGMRNRSSNRISLDSSLPTSPRASSSGGESQSFRRILDALADRDQRLIALLDAEGCLVELLGEPDGILRVPRGRPTNDILKLVTERLRTPLATSLRRVEQGEERVRYSVDLQSADETRRAATLDLQALEATGQVPRRILLTVQFEDRLEYPTSVQTEPTNAQKARIRALELELQRTQESLQATIEQLQAANEEQQTTNEELLSANQELQSTNEELQSVNEELHTINVEHQQKNQELSLMASDLENLIRNIGVGSLYLDSEHRIRKFTPAMRRVFNLVEHDIGRPIEAFAHALATDLAVVLDEVARTELPIEREVRDKTGAWLLMRTAPYTLRTGEIDGAIITFVEITKLKNSEEAAQIMNAQLSRVNQRLGEQSLELEELFSIVAHDLKRPVMALDGSLKLLQQELADQESPPSADGQQFLATSIAECERMRNLLADLANISRINRQQLALETFDLQPWLARCLDRYTDALQERNILLNATCDPVSVRAPRAALEQCLGNLIENAIRYGSEAASPRIDVSCQLRGDELFLAVVDNGRGIAPEHHERVFELFRRLDPDKSEGSGVGLVAVRRLIARAKGKVVLESEPGRGARFQIQIPIEFEESPIPRILLVEDDSLDAKSILRCLRGIRMRHEWVRDLTNAELLIEQRRFDLVILDLSLPDGHGLRMLPKLHQQGGDRIPCIIVSGHGAGLSKELEVEQAAFIDKSQLSTAVLCTAIESLLPQVRGSLLANPSESREETPDNGMAGSASTSGPAAVTAAGSGTRSEPSASREDMDLGKP